MRVAKAALAATLLFVGRALGQVDEKEKEPAAIVEIGAAGEWALNHGGSSYGFDWHGWLRGHKR